jgi:DNA-binding MarR family transcriptional regulator
MSNDTEPKRRGCCPPEAAIYRAVNENPRIEPITGTAREIADRLGVIPGHIRSLARSGRATKSGWTVDIVTPTERTGKRYERKEYIAECPGEDPIVGPVSEIAALTGLSESDVTYLIRYQGKSRKGWTVRRVTE